MAGSNAGFNAADFRAAIRTAMQMGAPPDASQQVSFHFPTQLVYTASADGADVPFDPNATVVKSEPAPVQVDCAVEYFDAENQPTQFGLLAATRVAITVFDEDYAKVKECAYVTLGGDRYDYRRTEPPSGLFDVGLFTMHFTAQSES